ncbi:hypothetical protein LZ30DRAFT_197244 [Colletotrichum cereale]|nr:hypothetical protein LZ30DRAFT_197244 [Colletotrichum cereale]
MRFLYPLVLLSCLCTAFPSTLKGIPLRAGGGAYTVAFHSGKYEVYTPNYEDEKFPVTSLKFQTDIRTLIIYEAYNGEERQRSWYQSRRLYLSEIIQAVATEQARVELRLFHRVIVDNIINGETLDVIQDFHRDYDQFHATSLQAPRPGKITVGPSDKFWLRFKQTPFFKTVNRVFQEENKMVVSIDIEKVYETNLYFNLGPRGYGK